MPRYDYDCAACGRRFEATHGVFEDGPSACPLCGAGPVKKAFSPPAIHFKGSGWAKKERQASSTRASRSAAAAGSDGQDAGSSDGATSAPATSDRPATATGAKEAKPASAPAAIPAAATPPASTPSAD